MVTEPRTRNPTIRPRAGKGSGSPSNSTNLTSIGNFSRSRPRESIVGHGLKFPVPDHFRVGAAWGSASLQVLATAVIACIAPPAEGSMATMGTESISGRFCILILAACCLVACQSSGSPELPFGIYAGNWNMDLAKLRGQLELHDGCLVAHTGHALIPLAFANDGTSWDSGRKELHIDNHVFRVGQPITLGGSSTGSQVEWAEPPPDSCRMIGTEIFLAGRP